MDSSVADDLLTSFEILLNDHSTSVIGAALLAWRQIFPQRYELLHPHFRKICRLLVDMDEWSQVSCLQILMFYAREHFPMPKHFHVELDQLRERSSNETLQSESIDKVFSSKDEKEDEIDEDLLLVLKESEYLFLSRNSAVVLSAVSLFFHLAPYEMFLEKTIEPLLRLLSFSSDIQFVVLEFIFVIASMEPNSFVPYISCFFLSERDSQPIREWKLRIMKALVLRASVASLEPCISSLMMELRYYLQREESAIAHSITEIVGIIGERNSSWSFLCVQVLSKVASHSTSHTVVSKAMSVLRHLIQMQPTQHAGMVQYLCCHLMENNNVMASTAKAHIIWLVGEYHELLPLKMSVELFRIFCTLFVNESNQVKLQTMNLGAKLLAFFSKEMQDRKEAVARKTEYYDFCRLLFAYIVKVAKYDSDYDVRDEARLFEVLLLNEDHPSLAKLTMDILSTKKPTSSLWRHEESLFVAKKEWRERGPVLGSFTHLFDGKVESDNNTFLPDWSSVTKCKKLRMEETYDSKKQSQRSEIVLDRKSLSTQSFYESSSSNTEEYSSEEQSSTISESEEESEEEEEEELVSDSSNEQQSSSKEVDNLVMDVEQARSSNDPLSRISNDNLVETFQDLGIEEFSKTSKTKKESNQVDLVFELSNSTFEPAGKDSLPVKMNKCWKRLVNGWNCGGIEIDYYVSRHPSVYGLDVCIVCLRIRNTNTYPVSNIKLVPNKASEESEQEQLPELLSSEEAFSLKENEVKEVAIHVKLKGRPDQLYLDLECSLGKFPVCFRFTVGEILRPEVFNVSEFEKRKSLMSGMLQMESRIYVPETTRRRKDDKVMEEFLHATILSIANVAPVNNNSATGKQQGRESTLYYSARIRGNEKLVLITLKLSFQGEADHILLLLNSEDIVIGSNLLHFLKRQIEVAIHDM